MTILRLLAGLVIALAGAVFFLQGLNAPFAPRSFMTADPLWIVLGLAAVVAGLGVAGAAWRRD